MENKTSKESRRKYDASFKQEVVNMIVSGRSVPDIALNLGIGENLIYRWRKQAIGSPQPTAAIQPEAPSQVPLSEHLALQKRLRELEMEHEILKKAVAIFSRPH